MIRGASCNLAEPHWLLGWSEAGLNIRWAVRSECMQLCTDVVACDQAIPMILLESTHELFNVMDSRVTSKWTWGSIQGVY